MTSFAAHFRPVALALFAAVALTNLAAHAQETIPGDACATAGLFRQSSGANATDGGHFLFCDGAQWNGFLRYTSAGSLAFGYSAQAPEMFSYALGGTANGLWTTAIGDSSQATGMRAFAAGRNAVAVGASASALGTDASANADNALAIGAGLVQSGANYGIAIGNSSVVTNQYGIAIGRLTIGTGNPGEGDYSGGIAVGPGGGQVNADNSFLISMHPVWGPVLSSAQTFMLAGANLIAIDPDPSDAGEGCLRFNETSDQLEYSHDCNTFTALGGGSASAAAPDRGIQFNSGGQFSADGNFVFTSAGRLGIGTTDPESQLHIYSASGVSVEVTSTAETAYVGIERGATNQWATTDYRTSGTQFWSTGISGGDADDGFSIYNWVTGQWGLYIDRYEGRVGVGNNTTPQTQLDVVGTLKIDYGGEACDASREGAIHYDSSDDTFYVCATAGSWTALGGGGSASAAAPDRGIQFNSGGAFTASTDLTYSYDGELGINTSDPRGLIDVVKWPSDMGVVIAQAITIQEPYTTIQHSYGPDYSAPLSVFTEGGDTVGAYAAAMPQNGTPGHMFGFVGMTQDTTVWGDVGANGTLDVGDYIPGLAFAGQTSNADGDMVIGAAINGIVDNTVTTGNLPTAILFRTSLSDAGGLTERMRIGSDGITTLRTTSTAGNAVLEGLRIRHEDTNTGGAAGIGAALTFNLETATNNTFAEAARIESIFTDATASSKDAALIFYTMGPNASGSTTTERVRITSAGDVGIGTTSPGSKLEVVGDMKADGLLLDSVSGDPPVTMELDHLGDVDTTGVGDGDCIVYNNGTSTWEDGACGGAGGTPAGANTEIQFNSNGQFWASDNFFYDGGGANPGLTLYDATDTTFLSLLSGLADAYIEVFRPGDTHKNLLIRAANVGIGTTTASPLAQLHVTKETATGNSVAETLRLTHADSDSGGAANIGAAMTFNLETATDATFAEAARIESIFTDATASSKDAALIFYTMGPNASGSTTTERMRIDSSGNVTIGTSNVDALLTVGTDGSGFSIHAEGVITNSTALRFYNNASPDVGNYDTGSGSNLNIIGGAAANSFLNLQSTSASGTSDYIKFSVGNDGATEAMRINNSGYLGILNNNPSVALDVTGDIEYTGTIADVSDRRLKTDIANLSAGQLEKIVALQGVSFKMIGDETGRTELGLIAQDVQPVFPDLVQANGSGTLSLNYTGLIAPMIEAMKEQQAQIAEQDAEIDELRAMNAALLTRLDALEAAQQPQ